MAMSSFALAAQNNLKRPKASIMHERSGMQVSSEPGMGGCAWGPGVGRSGLEVRGGVVGGTSGHSRSVRSCGWTVDIGGERGGERGRE